MLSPRGHGRVTETVHARVPAQFLARSGRSGNHHACISSAVLFQGVMGRGNRIEGIRGNSSVSSRDWFQDPASDTKI